MTHTADELLEEIRRLGAAIAATHEDGAHRERLISTRDRLRAEAARRADELRHPDSVRTELERIDRRLAEIEAQRIRAGYSEKHLGATVQDPAAYRVAINRRLAENHAEEVAELTERRLRLRTLTTPDGPGGSDTSVPSDTT